MGSQAGDKAEAALILSQISNIEEVSVRPLILILEALWAYKHSKFHETK